MKISFRPCSYMYIYRHIIKRGDCRVYCYFSLSKWSKEYKVLVIIHTCTCIYISQWYEHLCHYSFNIFNSQKPVKTSLLKKFCFCYHSLTYIYTCLYLHIFSYFLFWLEIVSSSYHITCAILWRCKYVTVKLYC